jgi:MFS family permease
VGRLRLPAWHFGLGRELGLAFWAMFFVEAAFGSYWNIWPLYISSLGASVPIVGVIVGASGLIRLFVMPPSAALADRLGSRAILVGARSVAFLGYFWAVFATDWRMLLPVVICQGIGDVAFPQIQAHVAAQSRGDTTRIFALVFVVGPGVALGIGPLLSGLAIGAFGLRGAIVLTAMFTLASVLCFASLRELAAAVRKKELDVGWSSEEPAQSSYRQALGDPNVRRIVVLHAATLFSLGLGVALLPYFLEQVRGIPAERIAQLGAIQAIGTIAFGIAASRLRWLQRNPFSGAAVAVAAVTVGLFIFTLTDVLPLLVIGFVLRGCVFSAWTLFSSAMGVIARPADRSRGFAMIELTGGTAFAIAPIVAGQIYEIGPRVPLFTGIVLSILVIPLLLHSQQQVHRLALIDPRSAPRD